MRYKYVTCFEIYKRDAPQNKQMEWKCIFLNHSRFLAHLVMSLCNHALSVVCRRRRRRRRCWCRRRWRLCTALPVTGLIIEASYLTNICSYAPSICT